MPFEAGRPSISVQGSIALLKEMREMTLSAREAELEFK